jgi:uncharacterized protein YkwD
MKYTSVSFLLLCSTSAASYEQFDSEQFKAQVLESYLREGKTNRNANRNVGGSEQDWLDAHNAQRKKYQTQYGGAYIPLQWSNDLKAEALKYAKQMTSNCKTQLPTSNPNDYGVNGALNQINPELAVNSWMNSGKYSLTMLYCG